MVVFSIAQSNNALVSAGLAADVTIAISFFIIPIALWYFVSKKGVFWTRSVFLLSSTLLVLCGISHLLNAVSVWFPVYGLQDIIRVVTGLVAVAAAAMLVYHLPYILKIPSASQLAETNKELQGKRDKLKAQNEFLRNLAYATYHDLREPIRGMAINAQVLLLRHDGQMNEEMREIARHITKESKRMFGSVDAILKLTCIESEKYKFEPVDLNNVLQKTIVRLCQQIKANHATIVPNNLPLVQGNENLLCVLFENIIANCIYFRSVQSPEITIEAVNDSKNSRIMITDNGIGFNRQYNQQIFEMFKTLGNSPTYRGPGLGLAMCRRIAMLHGGSIEADSKEGIGTTITITLPATAATAFKSKVERSMAA